MASTPRIDELKKKFDENPRRYFAPLANEFRKAGDIDQAIVICEEFLPQQPGHMSGHIVYGQALYEAGRLPESRAVFETALSLDPENLIALRHLGDIALKQEDQSAARTWYLRVLDADPRNEEIQALIASMPPEVPKADVGIEVKPDEDFSFAPSSSSDAVVPSLGIEKEVHPFEAVDVAPADAHPPALPQAAAGPPPLPAPELLDGFSLHGFDTTAGAPSTAEVHAPAEGLESTSFMPPDEKIAGVPDLDDSLTSGVPSFEAPTEQVESIAGLQGSDGETHDDLPDTLERPAYPRSVTPLDLDDGLVLPPQGDPMAASTETRAHRAVDDELPDFEMPGGKSEPAERAHSSAPELEMLDGLEVEALPSEAPTAVRAAEMDLIEAGEAPESVADSDDARVAGEAPVPHRPFATETMAELYLAQGFREEARAVYVRLLSANPADDRLRGLVDSLSHADAPKAASATPNVREFFARIAGRRAGERGASAAPPSYDDFVPAPAQATFAHESAPVDAETSLGDVPALAEEAAPVYDEIAPAFEETSPAVESVAPVVAVAAPEEPLTPSAAEAARSSDAVAPAIERAAAMRTPDGTVNALFSNRSPRTSEDSAASALAQAFGGNAESSPIITGRPARTASAELSLDSVFRDGPARPPRTSSSFSFDQFFTGDATAGGTSGGGAQRTSGEVPMPGEPPAERSAEDIEQFNSWLQGLKKQ